MGAAILLRLSTEQKEYQNAETFDWQAWLQRWLRFLVTVFFQVFMIVIPANILGIRITLEIAIYLVLLCFGILINTSQAGRSWDPNRWLQQFSRPFLATIILSIGLFLPYIL